MNDLINGNDEGDDSDQDDFIMKRNSKKISKSHQKWLKLKSLKRDGNGFIDSDEYIYRKKKAIPKLSNSVSKWLKFKSL